VGSLQFMATLLNWQPLHPPGELLANDAQQALARWNHRRLAPGFPDDDSESTRSLDADMLELERRFLDVLRDEVRDAAAEAPTESVAFISWFEQLQDVGPGQGDALFDWLPTEADLGAMRWYLTQEAAGEAGFDDLTAYTQVRLPVRIKLELARNYWDEMGRGTAKGMHGPMLHRLVVALALEPTIEGTVWESLALANAMTGMATRREFAWHALGALGVIELTAPARSAAVAAGLRRLGVSAKDRLYFELHSTLDVRHSKAWNSEAIAPAVAEDPRRAAAIAEGALMRLTCGARCFERYRSHLW
jgi:hypothetical protein